MVRQNYLSFNLHNDNELSEVTVSCLCVCVIVLAMDAVLSCFSPIALS